ncbi:ArfGap-domain-containing protein [Mycena floridula]|nr:ArfGap-domain-containing protein [Mycena floridula]
MDQAEAKKILQELSKREDLKNRICCDCSNPNPQWASLSFAVFICLQCAGTHRGFGVHISFVRSISMDTWQQEQVKRMQLGGNGPLEISCARGYNDHLSPHETYHCWAASQYRSKLDAMLAGNDWSPSAPPPGFATPDRPGSAQGLRKSRTSSRAMTGSSLRSDSASPASFRNSSPHGTPDLSQKAANESYFASMGQMNANRPDDLPPSQGGKYQGFGSTPAPSSNQHPSYGFKGWSLFSSAVVGATRVVNESVIQPGMEKVADPNLQASVKGYLSEAQKKATEVGSSANQWSKSQFGVDVADSVGGVVGTVRDKFTGGPAGSGYGSLSLGHGESSGLYNDEDDWDGHQYQNNQLAPAQLTPVEEVTHAVPAKKKSDWDDEWKDF